MKAGFIGYRGFAEKLKKLFVLMDESLTKDDFIKAFQSVVDLVLRVEKTLVEKHSKDIVDLKDLFNVLENQIKSSTNTEVSDVLTRVKEYYKDPNVWLSFGSFKYADGRMGFARPPVGGIHNQRISHAFTTSHLRAFRVSLFRKLELADICEDDGTTFIPFSSDLFFYQCMLEMAGDEHYKFCTDINYVYNDNDGSEHIVGMDKVIHYTNMAKTRPPKNVLESLWVSMYNL